MVDAAPAGGGPAPARPLPLAVAPPPGAWPPDEPRPPPLGPPGPPGEARAAPPPATPTAAATPTARSTLGVYRRLVAGRIRADWQYRTSFLLFLLGQTLVAALEFASIAVIFRAVDVLAGWTVEEVAYLYGTSGLAFGLADLFVSPIDRVGQHIRAGSFDGFLLRPLGTVWQLVGLEFGLRRLGRSLQPALVLVVALSRADVRWGPGPAALVVVSVLSGTAIYGALWVVTTAPTFWVIDSIEAANAFTYGGQHVAQYPLDLMGRWLRRVTTFVVPLASVAYLPGCWLFGKPFPSGLPRWSAWTGPLVALAMVGLARAAWSLAVRHYRSTGS